MSMLSYISAFQHPDHYRDIRSPLTLCWFKSCCSLVTELIREKKKKNPSWGHREKPRWWVFKKHVSSFPFIAGDTPGSGGTHATSVLWHLHKEVPDLLHEFPWNCCPNSSREKFRQRTRLSCSSLSSEESYPGASLPREESSPGWRNKRLFPRPCHCRINCIWEAATSGRRKIKLVQSSANKISQSFGWGRKWSDKLWNTDQKCKRKLHSGGNKTLAFRWICWNKWAGRIQLSLYLVYTNEVFKLFLFAFSGCIFEFVLFLDAFPFEVPELFSSLPVFMAGIYLFLS